MSEINKTKKNESINDSKYSMDTHLIYGKMFQINGITVIM